MISTNLSSAVDLPTNTEVPVLFFFFLGGKAERKLYIKNGFFTRTLIIWTLWTSSLLGGTAEIVYN